MRRLRDLQGSAPHQALGFLGLGFALGLGAGLVGGAEKYILTLLAGERFPVPLPLWAALALAFALAASVAYAAIMFLGRGIAIVSRAPSGEAVMELLRLTPGRSRAWAALYSLAPGVGHYYLGNPRRGRVYLSLTLGCALAGLLTGLLGLILLVESGVPMIPLLGAGLALLLLPGPLVLIAALDAFLTSG